MDDSEVIDASIRTLCAGLLQRRARFILSTHTVLHKMQFQLHVSLHLTSFMQGQHKK